MQGEILCGCTGDMAMKFPEWFYFKLTCILAAYWEGSLSNYPLQQLFTRPNDAVTAANIFGNPVVGWL